MLFSFHTFISYHSANATAAALLTSSLQRYYALRPWLDRDAGINDRAPRSAGDVRGKSIHGGDPEIERQLEFAVMQSLFTTVLTSPETLHSVWVRREVDLSVRNGRPLFFWHLSPVQGVETTWLRSGGGPANANPGGLRAFVRQVRSVAEHYEKVSFPATASIEFTSGLAIKGSCVIGHTSSPESAAPDVAGELNILVEMSEMALHRGLRLGADSLQALWPEYSSLCETAETLIAEIEAKFNRKVSVGRVPLGHHFRLNRPFALSRIDHLRRLLSDAKFRAREWGTKPPASEPGKEDTGCGNV